VSSDARLNHPVLVAAPFGDDAATMRELLQGRGYAVETCADVEAVAERVHEDVGLVLLTEEALNGGLTTLKRALDQQPAWSTIPFVLLTVPNPRRPGMPTPIQHDLSFVVANLIVLERPLSSMSLISAIDSAMRSRRRQFELRDRLQELSVSRRALQTREAELRLITDSLPVLIAFLDLELRYRFANAAYQEWFGRSPADLIGITARELIGDEGFELRRPAMARALAGEEGRVEVSMPHPDGRRREAEIRYLPRFDDQGRVIGIYVFVLDVTDRVLYAETLLHAAQRLEEAVKDRTQKLELEMASRAQAEAALRQGQKMEAIGQLTGGIAHDFNNMLTGIIGSLDVIKRRIASGRHEGIDKFMDAAFASAQRAAALTHRLLAYSRRQSLDSRPHDLNQLVASLEDLLTRSVNERIELEFVLPDNLPAVVADANQLETAILNLVINSRDAMTEGGRITIRTGRVDAPTTDLPDGEYVSVAVSDTGCGIDPETLERVFDPFFTTKPIGLGTGLGLSMVYGFAQQSRGHVRIHSQVGVGTTVSIYLPSADPRAVAADTEEVPASISGHGKTVLLVEDDHSVRMLVREVLHELGFNALEARESSAAAALLESGLSINLLISDVGLPGMNGRELAEVARRYRPELPILLITGYADDAADRAAFLGANMSMLTKPFDLKALSWKIAEILQPGD
jgi:PAS domain S-box-containing protein